jgi:hypothetical protein
VELILEGDIVARFITIGYGDEKGYTDTKESVRDAAHAHDEKLRQGGAVMGVAGKPTQVRNRDNQGIETTTGAYLNSSLPVAGFALIEAPDLQTAIDMVSRTPCAVARGVVEVWPLQDSP